ncbi:hypothetical protein C9374_007475 [Naegleria lovaniensis]|uniref:BTB domain-containing protein n=1 Tax=Naegleria lovaniensis TaxID=51637 RepID=A0AA88GLH3_NAELO|nr:uncharacterized protein C9374_007475 [Naegleria lovaniensis]KAG2379336.1 hypothetical protein C9374_007475 [Naegleria lovaniensis]
MLPSPTLQVKRKREENSHPSSNDHQEEGHSEEPAHLLMREQLERFRIEKLMKLKTEKERYEARKKELEILEKFMYSSSSGSNDDETRPQEVSHEKQQQDHEPQDQTIDPILDDILSSQKNLVHIHVGGKNFVTTLQTLTKRENMIKVMLNSDFKIDKDENGAILFKDRNPDYFPHILEHLRTGSTTHIGLWEEHGAESIQHLKNLLEESDFFGTTKLSERICQLLTEFGEQPEGMQEDDDDDVQEVTMPTVFNDTMVSENQHLADDEWISKFNQLTVQEKSRVEKYFNEHESLLEQEKQIVLEKESNLQPTFITFNVRGVKFSINIEKLVKHSESIFIDMLRKMDKTSSIFLDRDPDVYGVIFNYLESGNTSCIPKELPKQKQIYKEAKELRLRELTEYFDPFRYPIELLGEKLIKMKQEEDLLRNLYVVDRDNSMLDDPYLHLVSVFGTDHQLRDFSRYDPPKGIGLLFDFEDPNEASAFSSKKNSIPSVPKLCESRQDFFRQFNAFTYGLFKDMDWNNCFVAGGSVLAAALQVEQIKLRDHFKNPTHSNTDLDEPNENLLYNWDNDDGDVVIEHEHSKDEKVLNSDDEYVTDSEGESENESDYDSNVELVKPEMFDCRLARYYTSSNTWKNSDIDLFFYGLSEEQAENKIIEIFNLFKKNLKKIPHQFYKVPSLGKFTIDDIVTFRTEHAITFRFNNPIRPVQIILRIYKNPAEILMGFDVPSCCFGFDGNQLYCLPRAKEAIRMRCNWVDPDRQSTTYEVRLVKYAMRGFRIGVPGFSFKKVRDPIFVRPDKLRVFCARNSKAGIAKFTGLAKILIMRLTYRCPFVHSILQRAMTRAQVSKARDILKPNENHDYAQVSFVRTRRERAISISRDWSKREARLQYVIHELHKQPFFVQTLNDIDGILNITHCKEYALPQKIKWITIEPGRQYVGSFHPSTINFFADAYSKAATCVWKSKYVWEWRKDNSTYEKQQFDVDTSCELERRFKKFFKEETLSKKHSPTRYYRINEYQYVDLLKMVLVDKSGPVEKKKAVQRRRTARKLVKKSVRTEHKHRSLSKEPQENEIVEVSSDDSDVEHFPELTQNKLSGVFFF